jgi:exosome complex component RRP45
MRPPSPSIPEKEFLVDALKQSLRLDGRALLEQRTPRFTFGPELGWVECALDKTRYVSLPFCFPGPYFFLPTES